MIVSVVGSRSFRRLDAVELYVERYLIPTYTAIVSGGAPGTDRRAEAAAEKQGFRKAVYNASQMPEGKPETGSFWVIRPDYGRLGRRLGPWHRNAVIADLCDFMVAFWNGSHASGTLNVVRHAVAMGKRVVVYEYRAGQWATHWGQRFALGGSRK